MLLSQLLVLSYLQLLVAARAAAPATSTAPTPKTLNITTIAANAQKESILQCWELDAPFIASAAAGTTGSVFAQLGDGAAVSYGIIPPRFDGGLHNAPVVQWVAFLSGKAVVSLPNSTDTATVKGGAHGLILAADTANVSTYGHITKYPSRQHTNAIQIPLEDNAVPPHTVLHDGACVKAGEED